MKDFEHKDYFDARLCFHGDEEKVVAILDSYAQNQIDLTNINKVFELYHTKLFFEIVSDIPGWTKEKYSEYKSRTLKLNTVVHEFFRLITEDNVVAIFDECYVSYWDDFRDFFYKLKTYTCFSGEKICDVLKGLHWNTFQILQDKAFVEYFDKEITLLLEEQEYGLRFIVSHYLEEHEKEQKVYIPRSFTIDKRVTHAFVTMMNDISYFECKKRNGIWAFSRSELLKLFELEAKLVSDIGEHPMERPLKGVLMTTISNFILKSRYDYNSDFVAKYISSEVALKSISNQEIWIRETTLLNDSREEKVIPELFQDITWMQTDWAKNIEFTRTRHYYVSSFCKNYDDDTMKKKYGECVYGYKNDRLVELLAPIHLGHNEEEQTYPAFSQVIAFDVLYDKEMAKEEILFLCKIISLFKMDDSEKHDFLEEIMQYWILSVKDENWEEERERRYVIFMYDGYDYIDIAYQESDFLKVKTTIFLLPDFILGNNPAKYQIRASLDNKRQATAMKDYDLCPVCLSADFDSVLEAPCICKICGNGEVNRIKIQGTAKRI